MTDLAAIADAARDLAHRALAHARTVTQNGAAIDDHQVLVERVAYAATEARVIDELVRAPDDVRAYAAAAIAELALSIKNRLEPILPDLAPRYDAVRAAIAEAASPAAFEALGVGAIELAGRIAWPLDEIFDEVRSNVRTFAEREIVPNAERIHHKDELVPERFITEMAKLGYFGLSIPEQYGGHELGNLAMILTTEELSRASLAAAGSLITRPEILAKALLAGGTEEQKQLWLPKLAGGEIMAAISVTEPDAGSDVASLACRAEPAEGGWSITGAKAWCTFAGRADVIALLARTSDAGAKGLTLFVVEKPRFAGHEFEAKQPHGGTLVGKANRTPGYRGMHSFTLAFDDWRVPASHVVGGEAGVGRGFALQMAGFAAGRLQTGGRACGVTAAAVEQTARYVAERRQFGKPIGDFGLTRYSLGRMASRLVAARAITYAAALAMDGDERKAAPLAAMAKLFACDVAVEVTQLGQLLHGGWGYAEEYAISRYVADAQVLPIFEGVRPILALKVVGRALLSATCPRCLYQDHVCLCAAIPAIANPTRVVIVRHHLERHRSSNSGRLAHLALENSAIVEYGGGERAERGERTERAELPPLDGAYLLYPLGEPAREPPAPRPRQLVVLDATWSQARRMYRKLDGLRGLPVLHVPGDAREIVRLRESPGEGLVSTIEAIARALRLLDGDAVAAPLEQLYALAVERARVTGRLNR